MDPELRAKRAAAGRKGGQVTAARRAGVPHGTPGAVGVRAGGGSGGPGDSDDLVFGTAKQLRELAAAMTGAGHVNLTRGREMSNSRAAAFRSRHPDAEVATLVGRPICDAPSATAVHQGLRVRAAAGTGRAEMWIDDVIMWPNSWGEGICARDVRAALDDIDGADLVVHMNSPGGDVFEGVAIYQALKAYQGGVYIAVDALAASIASVIAMAGDTVGIGSMAFFMIHEASGFAYGTAADMLQMADLLDQVSGTIAGSYARKVTGTEAAYWRNLMEAETWMDAPRALNEGLADEALDPDEEDPGQDAAAAAALDDLFSFTRPTDTAPPVVPDPEPEADWSSLFRTDLEDLFL